MNATVEREALILVQHCVDWRTLRGKRDELGLTLSPLDARRLDELERFFAERALPEGAPPMPEYARRDQERRTVRLIVEYQAPGGVASAGVLCDLSGEGVYLETIHPLAPGERTVLRVFDRDNGREWRLGAAVVWVRRAKGMGLRFVGIPLEVRLGHAKAPRPLRRAA